MTSRLRTPRRWRCALIFATCLSVALAAPAAAEAPVGAGAPQRPNIVLILADDLGWNDVGYHGSDIATPQIDRIATQGIQLDRFYAQPTCSPTRAALMTGKSPARLGVTLPIAKFDPGGLPLDETLLPQYLGEAGYQTFLTGKWHLGHVERRYFPQRRGFDHFYGHVTGGVGYWDHNQGGGHDWQRNGTTVRESGYTTHLITDEAIELLAKRDKTRPTFLYVAYNAPHLPNEAPAEAIEQRAHIAGEYRRVHAAMVGEMDAAIGRLLAALDAEGMRDETILFFASDNGGLNRSVQPPGLLRALDLLVDVFGEPLPVAGLEFLRENAFEGGADNRPLRGGKMSVLEGGTRVPAAIWWPGHLEAGRSELFVTVQDVLPTLLDAAGLAAALPADLDGTSRLAALEAGDESAEHPDYLVQGLDGKALYRGPWKLILPDSPLPFFGSATQLYRVREDPSEANDLADSHRDVVEELTARIDAWPEGPSVHGSIGWVFVQPDEFGGEEFLPPWAEAAK